jgi:MFS family permease
VATSETRTPTDVDKIRGLPWLLSATVLNKIFLLLTVTGSVFLLFLDQLGLDTSQIGFLLSLIPFSGVIALMIAPTATRIGTKRVFLTFWTIRKLLVLLLMLSPWINAQYGERNAFLWVTAIMLGYSLCRGIAETGYYPWIKEAIPDTLRGKFDALINTASSVAAIIFTLLASYVVARGSGLGRFLILIAAGVALGLTGVWAFSHVPGGKPTEPQTGGGRHMSGMRQALQDRGFVLFLVALALYTIGGVSVISFIPLFMKQYVGLSDSTVILLAVGTYAGGLISSYLWGWAADRYGSKPVMETSLLLTMTLPIIWFALPRHSAISAPLAMTASLLAGVVTLAWQISWNRYLHVEAIPDHLRSSYMAVYYASYALASGIGPLLAGQLVQLGKRTILTPSSTHIDAYTPLFALSAVFLVVATTMAHRLPSAGTRSVTGFARLFLRGNPLRAFEYLIQYSRTRDEVSRVESTQRMGDAQSPLSAQELIEALNDPSSNVRYEAIHSISRLSPEPELVEALIRVLDGPETELSSVAARSLGRLGDPRAKPHLQRLLGSSYQFLEANVVRALAALGNTESIPYFLSQFRTQPSIALRIAYASALGRLGVEEAMGDIFDLLRHTHAPVLRGEVGLALARLLGDETYYMQQWRSLHADSATYSAQAMLSILKKVPSLGFEDWSNRGAECADAFATREMTQGASLLRHLLLSFPAEELRPLEKRMLQECAICLDDYGASRTECLLLSLHVIHSILQRMREG